MTSGHAYNHTLQGHFLTQQALASILLSQRSITQLCKIYEDVQHGEGAWQMLFRTLDQQFMQKRVRWSHCYHGYERPALGPVFLYFSTSSKFYPVREHMRLVHTSGDPQKETAFISCKWPHSLCKIDAPILSEDAHPVGWARSRMNSILIPQRKASLPSNATTGFRVVSGLTWP